MLYILAVTSIGVYGIVLAGWASGSVYPLLGGLRSSAQVVSYEIAMALSFAAVFIYSGTMSTSGIVAAQTDTWFVFLLLPSFLVYLTSMVGETNRAPFDLPRPRRTRRRFPHRVLLVEIRDVHARRVREHDDGVRAGHHAVPGRLARSVAAEPVGRRQYRLVAAAVVHREGVGVPVRVHVAARHPAPAALRPVHGAGMEDPHPVSLAGS